MNEEIEMLDIVSKDDEVIGKIDRRMLDLGKNPGFRVINAFLINSIGKIWVPRRHKSKRFFPMHLDASIGGHVMSGESYDEALKREAYEETSLVISETMLVAKLTPHAHGVSAFMNVYLINCDETPKFNENDFCEYYWLQPREVLARIQNGEKAKGDLEIILKKVFDL